MTDSHQNPGLKPKVGGHITPDGEDAVSDLFTQAQHTISKIQDCAEIDGAQAEDDCEAALEELSQIGNQLTRHSAKRLSDIARKITVWRALTQEEPLYQETAPIDERLLQSIIADVEKLARSH